eukprot:EG_transcript_23182
MCSIQSGEAEDPSAAVPTNAQVRSILAFYCAELCPDRPVVHLRPGHFRVVLRALQLHPRAAAKIGVGVKSIFVAPNRAHSERACFHVLRLDNSIEDFSYLKCLPRPYSLARELAAAFPPTRPDRGRQPEPPSAGFRVVAPVSADPWDPWDLGPGGLPVAGPNSARTGAGPSTPAARPVPAPDAPSTSSPLLPLEGWIVCLAGVFRLPQSELTARLERRGATVVAQLTDRVTHLICSDTKGRGSAKHRAALTYGVTILSEPEAMDLLPN